MTRSADDIWIIGVSMTRFGRFPELSAIELGANASLMALDDARIEIHDVDTVVAGSVEQARQYPAQKILKEIGQTGVPALNVLNACATGATAVRVVCQAIRAGEATIGLAVGCEQMGKKGLLGPAARQNRQDLTATGPVRRGDGHRRCPGERNDAGGVREGWHRLRRSSTT